MKTRAAANHLVQFTIGGYTEVDHVDHVNIIYAMLLARELLKYFNYQD